MGKRADVPADATADLTRPRLIFDSPGAFEVYGPDGTFERSVTVDIFQGVPGNLLLPLPDGRLVSADGPQFWQSPPEERSPPADHRRDILAFSLDGSETEVLYRAWDLPPTETAGQQGMAMSRMRAFEPWLHLAVTADGHLAVADSTAYAVKLVDADGGVAGTFGRPVAPVEVTSAIEDAERAYRIEGLSASPDSEFSVLGQRMAPGWRELLMQQAATMAFADEIPVIAEMSVDWEGRVWIARSPAEAGGVQPIDILTPRGDYMGTIRAGGPEIPDAFGPNGLMAYVETDDLEVQSVRVIRLVELERP